MMKRTFSVLFLMISCTTIGYNLRLQDKTLLLDPKFPGKLVYPTYKEECKHPNRRIFRGCKRVHVVEEYDLNDMETLNLLSGANFQCQSTSRFEY